MMTKEELINELKNNQLTIDDLKQIMLNNFVDKFGDLDISGLDFSDFDGNVDISCMRVKKTLYQNHQQVISNLWQDYQETGENLFQSNQKVKWDLFQSDQEVDGDLVQRDQKVEGRIL